MYERFINSNNNVREFFYFYAYEFFEKRIKECSKLYHIELKENLKLKIISSNPWGTYSYDDEISLNPKLIFRPIHLIDLVIVHELCHATHKNHREEFYKLLEEKMPVYRARKKECWRETAILYDLPEILYL